MKLNLLDRLKQNLKFEIFHFNLKNAQFISELSFIEQKRDWTGQEWQF